MIFQCLSRPLSSLSICLLVVLWGYALRTTGALTVFGKEVGAGIPKLYVLVPLSVLIGLVTGMLTVLVYATVIFACVTMPHIAATHKQCEAAMVNRVYTSRPVV